MTEKKVKILLVDDEARIVEVYSTMLREEGYDVTASSRAEEALRFVEVQAYDVVILDHFLGSDRDWTSCIP